MDVIRQYHDRVDMNTLRYSALRRITASPNPTASEDQDLSADAAPVSSERGQGAPRYAIPSCRSGRRRARIRTVRWTMTVRGFALSAPHASPLPEGERVASVSEPGEGLEARARQGPAQQHDRRRTAPVVLAARASFRRSQVQAAGSSRPLHRRFRMSQSIVGDRSRRWAACGQHTGSAARRVAACTRLSSPSLLEQ
jgi:hypothetical protein